jgi:hypothetical protein
MDIDRRNTRRSEFTQLVKSGVFFLLFVLLAFPGWAEENPVSFEFLANPVALKEKVHITLYLNHTDVSDVTVEAPNIPKGLTLLSGPTIRLYADEKDRNQPKKVRISYIFRADKSGRYIIDSYQVHMGKRNGTTDPAVFAVGVYRNNEIIVPLEAEWVITKDSVAVGEAVPVFLILKDLTEIVLVNSYSVTKPRRALFDEAPSLGEIAATTIGNDVLYHVPVTSFIFTPSQSGRIQIASARVNASAQSANASAVYVNVSPLPSEVSATGAIGDFIFSAGIDKKVITKGEETILFIRVEGIGNLNYLQLPAPDFGDVVLLEKTELAEYSAEREGYSGWREDTYRLVSETSGNVSLTIPPFIWLNKDTRVIESSEEIVIPVSIKEEDSREEDGIDPFPFSPQNMQRILNQKTSDAYKSPRNYLWLIPAPLAFAIMFGLKRFRIILAAIIFVLIGAGGQEEQTNQSIQFGMDKYLSGDYEAASESFLSDLERMPENAGIIFNLALSEYQLGRYAHALHYARAAVRLHPMNSEYWRFVNWLNEQMEFDEMVRPAHKIHPDIFYYALILFWSAGFAILMVQLWRNRGIYIILFVLSAFLAVSSSAVLVYSAVYNNRPTGIVLAENAELRKIPNQTAVVWLNFVQGQSVEILDRVESFYLVRTSFGLKGWADTNSIILDERVAFQ